MKLHPEMQKHTAIKTIRLVVEFLVLFPVNFILYHTFDILWRVFAFFKEVALKVRNYCWRYGRLKYWENIYMNAYQHDASKKKKTIIID